MKRRPPPVSFLCHQPMGLESWSAPVHSFPESALSQGGLGAAGRVRWPTVEAALTWPPSFPTMLAVWAETAPGALYVFRQFKVES